MNSMRSSAPHFRVPRKILAFHRVDVDLPSDLPMIRVDPVLFEQVLFNLLDNAGKYSGPEFAASASRHSATRER